MANVKSVRAVAAIDAYMERNHLALETAGGLDADISDVVGGTLGAVAGRRRFGTQVVIQDDHGVISV